MRKAMVVMTIPLLLIMLLINGICAQKLTVGDDNGWGLPPSDGFYDQWAAEHNFVVGDTLVFEFTTGSHDVATVTSKEAYEECDSSLDKNAVITTEGPYEVNLTNAGQYYYFCTFGSHCANGQKVAANVSATPNPPSDSSTDTPSPPPPTPDSIPTPTLTSSPTPDTTPTATLPSPPTSTKKDSSVGALITYNTSAIGAILMGVVLALLY